MRRLGVDFGSARIGLAVREDSAGISTPLPPIPSPEGLRKAAAAIDAEARRQHADALVLGIPESDENPRMAGVCRKLGGELRDLGWTVDEVDESFTSRDAEDAMRAAGLKASEMRKRVDGAAACAILDRWAGQQGP